MKAQGVYALGVLAMPDPLLCTRVVLWKRAGKGSRKGNLMSMEGADDKSVRLPAGRRARLVAYVAEHEQVTVMELTEHFGVSVDTIRRDLDRLHSEGRLVRTHGGAIAANAMTATEQKLDVRLQLHTEAKRRIGAMAAAQIASGSVVMLNGGTTTLAVARSLRDQRDIIIATNNLRVPTEISPRVLRDFYLFGGRVHLKSQTTMGPIAFTSGTGTGMNARALRCDVAMISVGGVSAEGGYSTSDPNEAAMMWDMMASAEQVFVLADSSKFGVSLFAQVSELGGAHTLITEAEPDEDLRRALEEAGVKLLIADGEPSRVDGRSQP